MVRLGSRRVLALALAAVLCSAAAVAAAGDKVHQPAGLPSELANPGGPPFLALGLGHMHNQTSGYGSSDSANVIFLNGSYTMTLLKQGGAELVEGRFLSWECASESPVNGTYRALVELTTTLPDGTKLKPRVVCQTGILDIDLEDGPWLDWGQSEDECPHFTNLSFDLFSTDHITRGKMVNTCGDPDYDAYQAAQKALEAAEAAMAAAEEAASAAADGALDGEPPSDSDEEQTVAMPSQVQRDEQPRGPFTPGRESNQ